jgi:hypothetical protein
MNTETLLLKPKPIEEDQKLILRGPIHKSNNRPCFYVLQKINKRQETVIKNYAKVKLELQ